MRIRATLAFLCLGTVVSAFAQQRETTTDVGFLPTYTKLILLSAEEPSVEENLPIDPAETADVWFSSSSADLELSLVDPVGTVYRAGGEDLGGVSSVILSPPLQAHLALDNSVPATTPRSTRSSSRTQCRGVGNIGREPPPRPLRRPRSF